MGNVTETPKKLITEYKETLSKAEYTFFQWNIHSYHRIPIFYGLPKVHKTPVTLQWGGMGEKHPPTNGVGWGKNMRGLKVEE
jgi:hypothetical protein